eukprot:10705861-Heterocapsa_arctica.AAC.1
MLAMLAGSGCVEALLAQGCDLLDELPLHLVRRREEPAEVVQCLQALRDHEVVDHLHVDPDAWQSSVNITE